MAQVPPLFVRLAGAVAYSRVHVGVHYPSEVAAGTVIGIASGLAVPSDTRLDGCGGKVWRAERLLCLNLTVRRAGAGPSRRR
jgi:membrane-associated phospholipid phosphatase